MDTNERKLWARQLQGRILAIIDSTGREKQFGTVWDVLRRAEVRSQRVLELQEGSTLSLDELVGIADALETTVGELLSRAGREVVAGDQDVGDVVKVSDGQVAPVGGRKGARKAKLQVRS